MTTNPSNPNNPIWRLKNRRITTHDKINAVPAYPGNPYQSALDVAAIIGSLEAAREQLAANQRAADMTGTVIGMLTLLTQLLAGDVGVEYTEEALWAML